MERPRCSNRSFMARNSCIARTCFEATVSSVARCVSVAMKGVAARHPGFDREAAWLAVTEKAGRRISVFVARQPDRLAVPKGFAPWRDRSIGPDSGFNGVRTQRTVRVSAASAGLA